MNCNSHTVEVAQTNVTEVGPDPANINTSFQEWVACGEDFSLYFWSGAPILYNYTVSDLT